MGLFGPNENDIKKQAQDLQDKQFEYTKQLNQLREFQRSKALLSMKKLLQSSQAYKIPDTVNKYSKLMTSLGGELAQLRDPSNKSGLNLEDLYSPAQEYDKTDLSGILKDTGIAPDYTLDEVGKTATHSPYINTTGIDLPVADNAYHKNGEVYGYEGVPGLGLMSYTGPTKLEPSTDLGTSKRRAAKSGGETKQRRK